MNHCKAIDTDFTARLPATHAGGIVSDVDDDVAEADDAEERNSAAMAAASTSTVSAEGGAGCQLPAVATEFSDGGDWISTSDLFGAVIIPPLGEISPRPPLLVQPS